MILFIFGGKSTALEIAETARLVQPDWMLCHVLGEEEEEPDVDEPAVRTGQLGDYLESNPGEHCYILSMAGWEIRSACLEQAREHSLAPATLIHPRAWVSPSARVEEGSYLAAGCRISARAVVGAHSMINYNVTYGHDTVSGSHLVVNPGAAIGGNVKLGERILVGANAFLFQGITVGDDCRIDALTHVASNIEAGQLCTSRRLKVLPRVDLKR